MIVEIGTGNGSVLYVEDDPGEGKHLRIESMIDGKAAVCEVFLDSESLAALKEAL